MGKKGFQGMGGMPNMNNMIKQAQKMQKQMQEMQAEVEKKEVEASAGGGAVVVKVTGKKEIVSIDIKPEVVDPDDVEMLQDLIIAAVNEAIRSAEEMVSKEMSKVTGNMNLPGLF
ncbi:DNA-binding protein, YbaB/EbfC family [Clostridium aceticum]|uniref:Nucleoid-associated protein CACET_c39290 n=1 Tax=Clostridium aceticum TaxID=84022 RepID=A0A0D8I7Z0_9CLOT|nr:YbaB/EbfC family nucleoid-associated protein [Clostridium aceticum]AKL97355.1 DNA-binding protein, YbaB/EbfC family [Clostridium aceticum]KJF26363.1 nucleoid-associated protein [Clostridium aceticum]